MRTGSAHLPLHGGRAPRWLFERMVRLAREVSYVLCLEVGPQGLLEKLSDPFWFQAFGCVLGFDWHSSGLTTTVCGALKEGLKDTSAELGFFICGGKGKTARKTPDEITRLADKRLIACDAESLVHASRLSAKVDNTALQDGYQLYHHTFFCTQEGEWAVVQQGMNEGNRWARRYHWLGDRVADFVCEPHTAICSDQTRASLNMVAKESTDARAMSVHLTSMHPDKLIHDFKKIDSLDLPVHHQVSDREIQPKNLHKILLKTYERHLDDYESLLGMQGVGPKTIRALALLSELIYGAKPSFRDPARFSFAHGGKDGHPYPVNKRVYDTSIDFLHTIVNKSKIGHTDKHHALKRLHAFHIQK